MGSCAKNGRLMGAFTNELGVSGGTLSRWIDQKHQVKTVFSRQ